MARARLLKPGFFKNEDLAQLSFAHRLLYEGLWCLADREGRLRDQPVLLRGEIFPFDDLSIDEVIGLLDGLEQSGHIRRYEADGKRLIVIPTFLEHQHPHVNEHKSRLPPPPDLPTRRPRRRRSVRGRRAQEAESLGDSPDAGTAIGGIGTAISGLRTGTGSVESGGVLVRSLDPESESVIRAEANAPEARFADPEPVGVHPSEVDRPAAAVGRLQAAASARTKTKKPKTNGVQLTDVPSDVADIVAYALKLFDGIAPPDDWSVPVRAVCKVRGIDDAAFVQRAVHVLDAQVGR